MGRHPSQIRVSIGTNGHMVKPESIFSHNTERHVRNEHRFSDSVLDRVFIKAYWLSNQPPLKFFSKGRILHLRCKLKNFVKDHHPNISISSTLAYDLLCLFQHSTQNLFLFMLVVYALDQPEACSRV